MPPDQLRSSKAVKILFEPFELNVAKRSLKKSGEAVPLGGRAFDLLLALIERSGETVGKNELIAKVWPDVIVEEGSLRVHMSVLRKALGDGRLGRQTYIANVKGRGYCFVAPVTRQVQRQETCATVVPRPRLPAAVGHMIGRDEEVLKITALLQTDRLTTIFGTGGIGKTTVALAVGQIVSAESAEAVYFIDLSTVSDRDQVLRTVVSALGFADPQVIWEDVLSNSLGLRKGLIILDSCEHLIDEVSVVAACILRRCPEIRILATSRETLQITGERAFRLRPLACPPEEPMQMAAQVLSYPAARLLLERIVASGANFELRDEDAWAVAEICRKLDGVPLAIELAAKRAAIFGLKDTAARLGARFDCLTSGMRRANLRHRTLRATLDWSYDRLSEVERLVFRSVAIFLGWFTLEAAIGIVQEIRQNDVADVIGRLVDKSMVESEIQRHQTSYRLFETTRSYALEKLLHSGEYDPIAGRHAKFLLLAENSPIPIAGRSSASHQRIDVQATMKRVARKFVHASDEEAQSFQRRSSHSI
jgi:predicted ATPase/DNA-binding winged helix-turn-helix (wHTH) protein